MAEIIGVLPCTWKSMEREFNMASAPRQGGMAIARKLASRGKAGEIAGPASVEA
jgi:hypothetical protein